MVDEKPKNITIIATDYGYSLKNIIICKTSNYRGSAYY
jgi:hypothetical protein